MKSFYWLAITFCLSFYIVNSQDFTVEDIEIGIYTKFRSESPNNFYWKTDSLLLYTNNDTLFQLNIYTDENKPVVILEDVNKACKEKNAGTLSTFPRISFYDNDVIVFSSDSIICIYSLLQYKLDNIFTLPGNAGDINISGQLKYVAYTQSGNLFLVNDNDATLQITHDSVKGIVNGEVVHRNEFGIEEGSFWSPNGNKLAYYKKDETEVTRYPLVNTELRTAKTNCIAYPMAGMKSEEVTLYVYDITKKDNVKIQTTGDPEQYLTNISWSPDEEYIYIQHLNREQNHMQLIKYNAITGEKVDVLFEEKHKKYVEPLTKIVFIPGTDDFIYLSSRDGYNHIYLYENKTNKLKQLTKGSWEVLEYYGYNKDKELLFFSSTEKSPLESQVYKYEINTNKIQRLTTSEGWHYVKFNKNMNAFIDIYSSDTKPKVIDLKTIDNSVSKTIFSGENKLAGYNLGKTTISTIKAADGKTDLYYKLVSPSVMEPGEKYPVIMYVYGGPHVQLVDKNWTGRTEMWQHYMAQHGYVTFIVDPRGSDNRGMEFENIIHQQLGIPQLEDYGKAIEFLSALDYIDTSRIGVHGWSFGGYMTIALMLKYPGIFKTGVAGGPVIDWKFYEVMYTERYMDTPQENPEGYDLTNLNNYAKNLEGKLLIIQGAQDPVVVPQHCMTFIRKCVEEKKQLDFFIYPTHEHNVRGIDRVHLTTKISDYFFDNL